LPLNQAPRWILLVAKLGWAYLKGNKQARHLIYGIQALWAHFGFTTQGQRKVCQGADEAMTNRCNLRVGIRKPLGEALKGARLRT